MTELVGVYSVDQSVLYKNAPGYMECDAATYLLYADGRITLIVRPIDGADVVYDSVLNRNDLNHYVENGSMLCLWRKNTTSVPKRDS